MSLIFPNIGNLDFVATSIALNLLTEFWAPLSQRLKDQLKKTLNKIEERQAEANANRLDDPNAKDKIKTETNRAYGCLSNKAKKWERFLNTKYKYLAISSAFTGVVILYLGISSQWNAFLLSPIPVLLLVNKMGGCWFTNRASSIDTQIKEAIADHSIGGKKIDEDFSINAPD